MEKLVLNLNNVHCHDCEDKVEATMQLFFKVIRLADESEVESVEASESTVYMYQKLGAVVIYRKTRFGSAVFKDYIKRIVKKMHKAGFEALSWEIYFDNELELDSKVLDKSESVDAPEKVGFFELFGFWLRSNEQKAKKNHLKDCSKCREDELLRQSASERDGRGEGKAGEDNTSDDSVSTLVSKSTKEFRAVFSIGGMTCASCVKDVSDVLEAIMKELNSERKASEPNFSVSLMLHSAVVIIPNKQLINRIIDRVEESGFDCKLIEILPVERSINTKVTAILTGMTCAACANSIQSAVKELPFILDSGINVVTKTGTFVMEEGLDSSNLAKLKTTIEDCGFDFEVISKDKINYTLGKKKPRTINISVDGMFCNHCPQVITNYLSGYGEAVVIEDPITLKHPFLKFTYVANQEKKLNIRRFLYDLNHLKASDSESGYTITEGEGSFKCDLVKEVTLDEHVRRLSKKETRKIIMRLALTTVLAIPTFIFGIVAMSLLPKTNSFRMWVEEPLWVGNVSRNTWILLILSTPVYLFAADIFHVKAIYELKSLWFHRNSFKKRLFKFGSMSLLMSLGTTVSYFASIALLILSAKRTSDSDRAFETTYFDSVVFLTFFLLIGRTLESLSKSKTADAIANLESFKASLATLVEAVKTDDDDVKYVHDTTISVTMLEVEDYIRISPGESPPVDCVIVDGVSTFDESALTGESAAVKHTPGHQLFSGTVNVGNTSLVAKIISLEGESLIDQIVSTVRDGQLRKAPIERTADTLTGYFVPVIVLLAVITWIVWLSLGLSGSLPDSYLDIDVGGWTVWSLEFAIAVFVIACPCGIGLAAPTALFVGSGLAAQNGILAKGGGVAFQDGASIKSICFDKTGTLTCGLLKVTDFAFMQRKDRSTIYNKAIRNFGLQLVRDLELSSKHPLAKSMVEYVDNFDTESYDIEITLNKVPQVENISGKGLKGKIELEPSSQDDLWTRFKPEEAILGNEALCEEYGVVFTQKEQDELTKWKASSKSVICVAITCPALFDDNKYHLIMIVACRDQLRVETKEVIHYLQAKAKVDCYMITGDNSLTAKAIGKEIEIPEERIFSQVLPEEKLSRVKAIKKLNNGIVAMVGDGINDSPALAEADVGIALSSGADLAVTSSDFILLNKSHPLITLITLIDLSKVVFRRVKFNFGWSLVYNMIGIPIAAGVIYPYKDSRLSPVWASAAMALSSVSVVTSSLALRLYRPKLKSPSLVQIEDEEVLQPQEAILD